MQANREEKVVRMLQKELGEIFLHYAREQQGVMISVSDVRVSPDMSTAKVYLSIFPNEKAQNIFSIIEIDAKKFRYELGKRIRHQVRIIPDLTFILDDSLNYLEKIDKLLKQ